MEPWKVARAACTGALVAIAGCAQIFGVDNQYVQQQGGTGGSSPTESSTSKSSAGGASHSSRSSKGGSGGGVARVRRSRTARAGSCRARLGCRARLARPAPRRRLPQVPRLPARARLLSLPLPARARPLLRARRPRARHRPALRAHCRPVRRPLRRWPRAPTRAQGTRAVVTELAAAERVPAASVTRELAVTSVPPGTADIPLARCVRARAGNNGVMVRASLTRVTMAATGRPTAASPSAYPTATWTNRAGVELIQARE